MQTVVAVCLIILVFVRPLPAFAFAADRLTSTTVAIRSEVIPRRFSGYQAIMYDVKRVAHTNPAKTGPSQAAAY